MSSTSATPFSRLRSVFPRPATTLVAALAVGVGLGLVPAQATAAPAAPAAPAGSAAADPAPRQPALPGGTVALTWAPLYMSDQHEYTRSQAVSLARKFDLISAMPYGLMDHSSAMRAANRDLTLLAYSNATLASPDLVRSFPEAAFAHNASGGRIKAVGWDTYLMQPDNNQWRAAADKLCVDRSALGGFDGCLVDMLTLGIFARGYMTSLPAVPGTGRTYSQAQYRDEMVSLAADLRSRSPQLVQIGNMIENSYRYWESDVPSRPLVNSSPSAQMEDFLRGANNPTNDWPSTGEWKKNVDVITDMERSGKTGLFTTKLWSRANKAAAAQWQGYSMASFLMGANGHSFFAFTRSRDKAGAGQSNARYRMPTSLGMPRGAMSQLPSGAWIREFAGGAAVVNPTGSSVRVQVPGTMKRLNGTVVNSLTLPAHSGDVLVTAKPTPYKVNIKSPKKVAGAVRPGRWSKVLIKVDNPGGKVAPRGKLIAKGKGRGVKARNKTVGQLRPGRSTKIRVPIKASRGAGRFARVRLVYTAGGKRDAAWMKVRVGRR